MTSLSQADAAWLIRYLNNWLHIYIDGNNIVKSGLLLWSKISFSVLMGFTYPARALWEQLNTAVVLYVAGLLNACLTHLYETAVRGYAAFRLQSAAVLVLFKCLYLIYFSKLSTQCDAHWPKSGQMSRQTSATALWQTHNMHTTPCHIHISSLSSENHVSPNLVISNILDKLKD